MVATRAQTKAENHFTRSKAASKPPSQKTTKPPKRRKGLAAAQRRTIENSADQSSPHSASEDKPTAAAGGAQSTILEKGVLYFFTRPKVDVGDDPHGAADIQRSFLVLRPLPTVDSKDDVGVAPQGANCRILVLPKKALPNTSKHDRFLTFVKEPSVTVADISEQFKAETYSTKTRGERTNPAAVPIAEAVYALIASQDRRSTHLAYMCTLPEEITSVQIELGIAKQGSFVAQTRNPRFPSPPQAQIPAPAEFEEKIIEEFDGKRWMPLRPYHLTYKHAEILLIGSSPNVARNGKEDENVVSAVENLEGEDKERVGHIGEEDAVFKDLRLRKEHFAKIVQFSGTWNS